MNSKLLGRYGESLAADFMRKKGYEVLAGGYHSMFGEIDLICKKGNVVSFVEVKTRQDMNYLPAFFAVGPEKQNKIKLTARQWISENDCRCQYSFDIIEIYLKTKQIRHTKNAFA